MSEAPILPTVTPKPKVIPADTVFAALGDRNRRRLLVALFDGKPRPGRTLATAAGIRFDNARKHLDGLASAGLVISEMDPSDKRRQVYTLAPSVKVAETPEGRTVDFGYCVVRV